MNKAASIAIQDALFAVIGGVVVGMEYGWEMGLAYFCAVKALTPYAR